MLLKQLLESPKTSSNLVVYDPFGDLDREELVKEVVALANADVDGPRNILFGVNAGGVNGHSVVGIPEDAVGDLKKAHRLLSALIEPVLQLAFVFDRINGKLVGALEIDGCDFGPYFVGHDWSNSLSLGQCWIREGREIRAVERADLVNGYDISPAPVEQPARLIENPDIEVGFNEEPDCKYIELSVPDTSDPPFSDGEREVKKSSRLRKAIKDTVGTVTTQILRLGHGADKGDTKVTKKDSPIETGDEANEIRADAQNHYFYEEKALRLNLCASNQGKEDIEDISIELGFPRLPGFDIADRLYTSPFDKRSTAEIKSLGYPEVESTDAAIFVRSSIGLLAPDKPEQLYRCELRLVVGPEMKGRKLAVHYKLRAPNRQKLGTGRLKIRFG
ncbi:MAG: ATP-binding protein [Gammaproteobacteria bacterium]